MRTLGGSYCFVGSLVRIERGMGRTRGEGMVWVWVNLSGSHALQNDDRFAAELMIAISWPPHSWPCPQSVPQNDTTERACLTLRIVIRDPSTAYTQIYISPLTSVFWPLPRDNKSVLLLHPYPSLPLSCMPFHWVAPLATASDPQICSSIPPLCTCYTSPQKHSW